MRTTHLGRLTVSVACAAMLLGCRDSAPGPAGSVETVAGTMSSEPWSTEASTARNPASTVPRTPRASARVAVLALLEAEQQGNHRASYRLLSRDGVTAYPSEGQWTTHRLGVAPVTDYRFESANGDEVTVLVERAPAIDPFVGLQFGAERQTWRAVNEVGGWLVQPEPAVDPVVPSDGGAREIAGKWARARQSCDEAAQRDLEAVATPFGLSTGAGALCRTNGTVGVAQPRLVIPGPLTAPLVEQYGPSVVRYLRSVEVSGGPQPFTIFLIPLGDSWRVIAAND